MRAYSTALSCQVTETSFLVFVIAAFSCAGRLCMQMVLANEVDKRRRRRCLVFIEELPGELDHVAAVECAAVLLRVRRLSGGAAGGQCNRGSNGQDSCSHVVSSVGGQLSVWGATTSCLSGNRPVGRALQSPTLTNGRGSPSCTPRSASSPRRVGDAVPRCFESRSPIPGQTRLKPHLSPSGRTPSGSVLRLAYPATRCTGRSRRSPCSPHPRRGTPCGPALYPQRCPQSHSVLQPMHNPENRCRQQKTAESVGGTCWTTSSLCGIEHCSPCPGRSDDERCRSLGLWPDPCVAEPQRSAQLACDSAPRSRAKALRLATGDFSDGRLV